MILKYSTGLSAPLPGMLYRHGHEAITKSNNTRIQQQDRGTMVPDIGQVYGVTIEGIDTTIVSTGVAADDAALLAAAIKANASLIAIVEDAEALGDDILVTYFDFETHPVMVAITAGLADVTPIAITRAANPGEALPFGYGVSLDQTDASGDRIVLPDGAGAGARFAGIVMWSSVHANWSLPGNLGVPVTGGTAVARKAMIYVALNQDVALLDPVYLQVTQNGANMPGQFRMDDDGGNAELLSPGFRWERPGTAAAGIAVLDLNFPG